MSETSVPESDLLAYVDEALERERRAEVERYLAEHPDEAEKVAAWARQNEALNALYAPLGDEPVPPRLDVHRLASRLGVSGTARAWPRMAAAALVCLAIGAAGGWTFRAYWMDSGSGQSSFVDEAVTAHNLYTREVAHPVEVGADQQAHLAAWLSRRLDRTLVLPDLQSLGFDLVGGRLLPAQGRAAAQLMYEDDAGQRVTFLILPTDNGQESSLRYAELGDIRSITWTDETIRCVLVGRLARDRLRDIAAHAYEQLG